MEKVGRLTAIKNFFAKDVTNPPSMQEIRSFWLSCSEEEKKSYSEEAAEFLGIEISN